MESSRPSLDFLLEMSEPESRSGSPAGSGSGGELHRLGRGDADAAAAADDDDDGDGEDSQKEGSKDSGEGSDEQQSDGQRTASKSKKKILAKAIYDNIAESTDELAFRKGDILTVIETDTSDLKGWWLCQLRGRQGICPGNRLKIIQPHDSGCFTLSPASSPCPSIGPGTNLNSPVPSDIYENTTTASSISSATSTTTPGSNRQQLYQNQHQGKRRSWHINPNKVIQIINKLTVYTTGNSKEILLKSAINVQTFSRKSTVIDRLLKPPSSPFLPQK
ncbi:sorbin and SH3 domain-containing protein 2-like isoform X1 [Aedes albopictus]|uniref:SH3 domain-containing protein n=1 Tax=Aedes albopictus TaxID=7160 RepID=A0ABM1ZHC4_AEDAL